MVEEKYLTKASSIFRANLFGSWVVTHALEIDDFHAHLAAVCIKQHLLSIWMSQNFDIFLRKLTVYPTLSVLLTKTRPTKRNTFASHLSLEKIFNCLFKVWEEVEPKRSKTTIHWLYLTKLHKSSAILREISAETSYQIVRWVFRRYTQLRQAICTSTLLRDLPSEFPLTSINSSIGHNLSGPSIKTTRSQGEDRILNTVYFHFEYTFKNVFPRFYTRLLGSCFKTSGTLRISLELTKKPTRGISDNCCKECHWCERFQVLFHWPVSLLFTFPSRYLFAIGLQLYI